MTHQDHTDYAHQTIDLLIHGGTVIDGTGAPRQRADVGVRADRVVAIGDLTDAKAHARIDASGLIVAPGFIDAHTHDDRMVLSSPDMTAKLSQGVTTVVAGNCGISLAPLVGIDPPAPLSLLGGKEWFRYQTMAEYLDEVDTNPPALNIASMIGHSTLRAGTMDRLDRAASAIEIERMAASLEEAMQAGCIGMSTGLAYPPAICAPTDEIVALAKRVARRGGLYATHMRNEKEAVVESVRETLEIGRLADLPVVISHHKCSGRANFGLTRQTLDLIAQARKHQTVNLDVYPYTASSTVLLADWVPAAERVLVTWSKPHPECQGRDLEELAQEWGLDIEGTCARLQPAGAIYFQMDEADLRRVMRFEDTMIGSDGLPHDAFPHPRLWATFPRVLGHYSRDEGLFPLEQAVRKMTSIAADVFGLSERGRIRAGGYADIVLFDAERVLDTATFKDPIRPAAGIENVLVNGQIVFESGKVTPSRPGRMLRRAT